MGELYIFDRERRPPPVMEIVPRTLVLASTEICTRENVQSRFRPGAAELVAKLWDLSRR